MWLPRASRRWWREPEASPSCAAQDAIARIRSKYCPSQFTSDLEGFKADGGGARLRGCASSGHTHKAPGEVLLISDRVPAAGSSVNVPWRHGIAQPPHTQQPPHASQLRHRRTRPSRSRERRGCGRSGRWSNCPDWLQLGHCPDCLTQVSRTASADPADRLSHHRGCPEQPQWL